MKRVVAEVVRWLVIAASGGCGIYCLCGTGQAAVAEWNRSSAFFVFLLVLMAILATPCFAVAYIVWRRAYRKLLLVLGGVGALIIYGGLIMLPGQLGMHEFMVRHVHEDYGFAFLALPVALLSLFVPIYAAAWFFRFCRRLASPGMATGPKRQATHWLIWLGFLCIVGPWLAAMAVDFCRVTQSGSLRPEAWPDAIQWRLGSSSIGVLLVFLGLVRRRPVPQQGKATACNARVPLIDDGE
jgi:hypothetical protein